MRTPSPQPLIVPLSPLRRALRGFTYLTILFILTILGGGLALTGEVWHTAVQREKETELLFTGNEYRKAIERYFSFRKQYPRNLDDLLKDPRKAATERYLRKKYVDPVSGKAEWGVVKAADGGIMGVYSLSDAAPLKSANFREADKIFDGSGTYSDWKFVYSPTQQGTAAAPASKPAASGTPAVPVPPAKP